MRKKTKKVQTKNSVYAKKHTSSLTRGDKIKNIAIILLCLVVLGEGIGIFSLMKLTGGAEKTVPNSQIVVNVQTDGIKETITSAVGSGVDKVLDTLGLAKSESGDIDIMAMVNGIVFSDTIVNVLFSMGYPLLYNTMVQMGMIDFAEYADLYATGEVLASHLQGNSYTCVDKDGTRKNLKDVISPLESDWTYMDTQVTWTDDKGESKTTTIWNSCQWGVTDKESFFNVLDDMTSGLRGVVEVALQSKDKHVNVNLVDFLLNVDSVNVNLDAATIYNSSKLTGYEASMVPLYKMLGLKEGEYKSVAEFTAYTSLKDIWLAMLDPVFLAVEKIMGDPVNGLLNLLCNFVDIIETGTLYNGLRCLKLDGEFNELAAKLMGFQNGELFNLGDTIIDMMSGLGADISGDFNSLLNKLVRTLLKDESINLPTMDTKALLATARCKDGYYTADTEKTASFLVEYAVNSKFISLVIDHTPLKGTVEGENIVKAFGDGEESFENVIKSAIPALMKALEKEEDAPVAA